MQHCLRIALWVFLFCGYLQARAYPVTAEMDKKPLKACFTAIIDDLHLEELLTEVKCNKNVTFASPTNVQKQSYGAALETFKEGLQHANANCTDVGNRADDTFAALEQCPTGNSSEGTWERKTFEEFVKDLETFTQLLLSQA